MNIIGVIPARAGSKGLPGKNIKPVNGIPMIAHVIRAALDATLLDRVIVSTDGQEIADIATQYGAEVLIRPPEISGDTAAIEDSLRHVVRHLDAREAYRADVVVLMQTNVPIRKPGAIDEAIDKLINSGFDSVVSVFAVNQRPEWMKKATPEGTLKPFMQCAEYRRQLLPQYYMLDGAIEAIRTEILMATEGKSGVHVYFGEKMGYIEYDRIYSMDVDSSEDFAIVESAMQYLQKTAKVF